MNRTLWAIDSDLDDAKFEDFVLISCVDMDFWTSRRLSLRTAGAMRGIPRKGRSREGHPTFFQFSKEENWTGKAPPRRQETDSSQSGV